MQGAAEVTETPGAAKGTTRITEGAVRIAEEASRISEEAALDLDIEDLLRDTPEPQTPPVRSLTPGAVRMPVEAANELAEDMEAVVDRLQAVVERLMPWLKDDISSGSEPTWCFSQ